MTGVATRDGLEQIPLLYCVSFFFHSRTALPFLHCCKLKSASPRELASWTGPLICKDPLWCGSETKELLAFGVLQGQTNVWRKLAYWRAGPESFVCSLSFLVSLSLNVGSRTLGEKAWKTFLFCFVLFWPNTIESLRKGWLVKKTQQGEGAD